MFVVSSHLASLPNCQVSSRHFNPAKTEGEREKSEREREISTIDLGNSFSSNRGRCCERLLLWSDWCTLMRELCTTIGVLEHHAHLIALAQRLIREACHATENVVIIKVLYELRYLLVH